MKKKIDRIIAWVLVLAGIIALSFYVSYDAPLKVLLVFLAMVFFGFLFYKFSFKNFNNYFFKLSSVKNIFLSAPAAILIVFFTSIFIAAAALIFYSADIFSFSEILRIMFNTTFYAVVFFVFIFIFFILTVSLGKYILDFFKINTSNKKIIFLLQVAVGFVGLSYLSFFIAASGALYFWFCAVVFACLLFLIRKNIIFFVKEFFRLCIFIFTKKPTSVFEVDWLRAAFWLFAVCFFALVFVLSLKFYPSFADDITTYYRVPEMFAYYHKLIPFENSITSSAAAFGSAWQAVIFTLLADQFVFVLTPVYFLFLLFVLYVFTENFYGSRIGILTIWLAALTNWHLGFLNTQKFVFLLSAYSLLSIFLLTLWLQDKKRSEYLYLAGIFLGFSLCLKINTFFLIIPFFALLFYLVVRRRLELGKFFLTSALVLLFFLPVGVLNYSFYENPLGPYYFFQDKQADGIFSQGRQISYQEFFRVAEISTERGREITLITRQNHISENGFKNFFWSIWNVSVKSWGFDTLGPILLITLPFFGYVFIKKYHKDKTVGVILFLFFGGLGLWFLFGKQRMWYMSPIIYPVFILSALVFRYFKNKLVKYFLIFMLFILSALFFATLAGTISFNNLQAVAGLKTPLAAKQNFSWYSIAQKINQEIESGRVNKILITPSQNAAYVIKNDKYLITDGNGSWWGQVAREGKDFAGMSRLLKEQGITHIGFIYSAEDWYRQLAIKGDMESYGVFQDIKIFREFSQNNLEVVFCSETFLDMCLYKLK